MAKVLDVESSLKLLKKYKIPVAKSAFVREEEELKRALKGFRFPVVLKVVSEKISHKTDVNGVRLGIQNFEDALKNFKGLKKLKGFEGVLVQEQLFGREIIIGGKRDSQFGPTVLFGLGGVFVEVMKDFSLRICPLRRKDAAQMVREIKGLPILKGARGKKPINFKELEEILLKTSKLMIKETKVKELDINPLIANRKKVVAVDARVVI